MFEHLRGQSVGEAFMDAIVIDNLDPKQVGRLKIRARAVHEGVPDEHLPWALCLLPMGRGPKASVGSVAIPEIGVRVAVMFQGGDPDQPVVIGVIPDLNTFPTLFKTNYTKRSGSIFANGTHVYLDEETNELRVNHQGTTIVVDTDGKVTVNCADNATVNVAGDASIQVSGELASTAASWTHTGPLELNGNLDLTGNFNATGAEFKHNGTNVGSTHIHGNGNDGSPTTQPIG